MIETLNDIKNSEHNAHMAIQDELGDLRELSSLYHHFYKMIDNRGDIKMNMEMFCASIKAVRKWWPAEETLEEFYDHMSDLLGQYLGGYYKREGVLSAMDDYYADTLSSLMKKLEEESGDE